MFETGEATGRRVLFRNERGFLEIRVSYRMRVYKLRMYNCIIHDNRGVTVYKLCIRYV